MVDNAARQRIDQADFNDESRLGAGREMQDRLSRLVAIFEGLDFRANRAGGDDLLGDAYEYLMRHFATESGKSKGQFYTPAEVSRVMAQVVGVGPDTRPDQTLYDPACGWMSATPGRFRNLSATWRRSPRRSRGTCGGWGWHREPGARLTVPARESRGSRRTGRSIRPRAIRSIRSLHFCCTGDGALY